jgi:hypothetical protein
MAIVRKTGSGKAVHFITDDGIVYSASYKALLYVLSKDNVKGNNFIVLARMPFSVSDNRFPKSPVYDPVTKTVSHDNTSSDGIAVKANDDAYSDKSRAEFKQVKIDLESYSDKNIDW